MIVNDTIKKVKDNLTREKQYTELDESIGDEARITGQACWFG